MIMQVVKELPSRRTMIDRASDLQKAERTMSGYLAFTSKTSRSPSVVSTEYKVELSDASNSVETIVCSSSSAPGRMGSGVLDGGGGGD